jgi:thiamine transport system substrate-binding protein
MNLAGFRSAVLVAWLRASFLVFVSAIFFLTPLQWAHSEEVLPELTLYTYDSILTKGGLGAAIFPLFEKLHPCRIRPLAWGDAGQIVTRLETDGKRKKPGAQLVLGIDQQTWETVKPWIEGWGNWQPKGYAELSSELKVERGFLPYDYSYLGLMANEDLLVRQGLSLPHSIEDLQKPDWKRNIILEDPRTSTPGLSFLLFTEAVLGGSYQAYWEKFRTQWLTLAPSWNSAYQLFLRGEAPLVWSYVTSQAYHEESLKTKRTPYQAVLFKEGQPLQIEGAGWVKSSTQTLEQRKLVQAFLEFLLSREVQALIPKSNWMLPVRKDVQLPESFAHLPRPSRVVRVKTSQKEVREILQQWARSIQK